MADITIISHVDFWNLDNGAKQRVFSLVKYLESKFNIQYFFLGEKSALHLRTLEGFQYSKNIFFWEDYVGLTQVFRDNLEFYNAFPQFAHRVKLEHLSALQAFVREHPSKVYLVEYLFCGSVVDVLPAASLKILDTHDLLHRRAEVFASHSRSFEFPISKDEEFRALRYYDYVVAIQNQEYQELIAGLGKDMVILAPHPIEISSHNNTVRNEDNNIGFFGGPNIANYDALLWFLRNVWVQIYQENVKLYVFGAICQRFKYIKVDGMVLKGVVSDLSEAYRELSLAINPAQYGSGLKIKSVEAIGNKVPLVTTSVGAQGLPNELAPFVQADLPEDFANSILELKDNPLKYNKLLDRCEPYTEKWFSPDVSFALLVNIIKRSVGIY